MQLKFAIQLDFPNSTNNTAEYEGLLTGLWAAIALDIKRLVVRGDSQLMINQVNKDYDCPQMAAYVDEVRKLERKFKGLRFEHVKRKDNFAVDELSKLAAERRKV